MFPYANPQTKFFYPAVNFSANLALTPVMRTVGKVTITRFAVTTNGAAAPVEVLSNINAYLVAGVANSTIGSIKVNTTTTMAANVAVNANLNSSLVALSDGTLLQIRMNVSNEANVYWGAKGFYQLDYVQGAPGDEAVV